MDNKATQSETQKIPKLRFSEFSDEWEEKKLGEVGEFWNGKAHEQDISVNGKYIVVNSKFISQNGEVKKYSDKQTSPLKKGDITIVMSDIPNGKAIGKCFLIDEDDTYTLNQRIGGIKSKEMISPFLVRILNRNKYFLKFDNGVSQTNLRKDEVLGCPIIFPTIPEQKKIADFLDSSDEWIYNLKIQKESLVSYKKGMMQKIFSQEIRFKDDKGVKFPNWEEKKLGEVANFRRGSFPQPYGLRKWYDDKNGFPFVQVFDVDENFKLKSNTKRKITIEAKNLSVFVEKGTIVLTIQGSIGRIALTQYDACVDRTLLIFKSFNKPVDKVFFMHIVFLLFEIEKKKAPGGTIKTITKEALSSFKLLIPSLQEQQKIAEFLTSIDKVIESKQLQIDLAKSWKKGLMQRMFV